MRGTKNRLGRVLRVREMQEEVARAAWLEAELAARGAEEESERCHARARDERAALGDQMQAACPRPAELLWRHGTIDALDARGRRFAERAKTLRFQADQARAPWEERRRDVRALERLQERSIEAERKAALAAETAALDEVALARAARRNDEHQTPG